MTESEVEYFSNIILVSGNGRNVGKTTFICELINQLKILKPISVKVSSHFHSVDLDKYLVLNQSDDFILLEEKNHDGSKDSNRMLRAGADKVFFLMVKDDKIGLAFNSLKKHFSKNVPIIIESASFRQILKPSLFFIVFGEETKNLKKSVIEFLPFADKKLYFDGLRFSLDPGKIIFNQNDFSFHIQE